MSAETSFKLPIQSRTIIAAAVGIVATTLQMTGVTDFFTDSQEQEHLVNLILEVTTIASGVGAIFGRYKAKSKIVHNLD